MPPRSKLEMLPAEKVERIKAYLGERVRGVDEFTAWLADELGVEVGRSSAHRFQQEFEEVAATMRQSREMASALAEAVGPDMAAGKMGRMLVEIFQKIVFDFLVKQAKSEEPLDPQSFMLLGRAIRDAVGALKVNSDQAIALRKEAAREHAAKLDAALDDAKAAGEKGLSAERVAQLRREFLGAPNGA